MAAERVAERGPGRDALGARVDRARPVVGVAGEPGKESPAHGAHAALLTLLHHDEEVLAGAEIPARPEIGLRRRRGAELRRQHLGGAGPHDATAHALSCSGLSGAALTRSS